MPRQLFSNESMEYLSANKLIQGRRVLSVSSYSSDSNSSQSNIDVPENIYSYETLIFCDFCPSVASAIYNGYQHAVERYGEDFVDFSKMMKMTIEASRADACYEGDDWETALLELGANQDLINRLMDPHWKDVRLLRTAKDWVWFVTSSRLDFLELLDAGIKERARKAKARQGNTPISGSQAVPTAPSSSKLSVTPFKNKIATSGQEGEKSAETCQTYYKGGLMESLRTAEGPGKSIFPSLLSTAPGDFGAITGGLYLMKHRQMAWEYAQMCAHVVDSQNMLAVGILTISIPVDILSNSYTIVGDEWRAFAFANRRIEARNLVAMGHLNDYDWLQGPICGQSTAMIQRMTSKEELILMKIGGEPGHQIWTGKLDILVAVEKRAQASIRVEQIFPESRKGT